MRISQLLRVHLGAAVALLSGLHISAPAVAASHDPEEVTVEWKGKRYDFEKLPVELSDATFDPVEVFGRWAEEAGYRLLLSEEGRVLFIVSSRQKQAKSRLKLVEATLKFYDQRILAPSDPSQATSPLEDDAFPEQAITILEFRTAQDQQAALDRIAQEYPYYGTRLESLKSMPGFLLPRTNIAGWQEHPAGGEEWRAEHELIHRTAQLLLTQDHGELPKWLNLGVGWYAEYQMKKGVYCFPDRASFVAVQEHSGWEPQLKHAFKKRLGEPFQMQELARCQSANFDADCAALAWGLVTYLCEYRPGTLARISEQFQAHRRKHPASLRSPQSTTISPEVQSNLVLEVLGEGWTEEASKFFREGRRYRPPKTK